MRKLPHEKSDRRMRMTIDSLKKVILSIANKYPIKKVCSDQGQKKRIMKIVMWI